MKWMPKPSYRAGTCGGCKHFDRYGPMSCSGICDKKPHLKVHQSSPACRKYYAECAQATKEIDID